MRVIEDLTTAPKDTRLPVVVEKESEDHDSPVPSDMQEVLDEMMDDLVVLCCAIIRVLKPKDLTPDELDVVLNYLSKKDEEDFMNKE